MPEFSDDLVFAFALATFGALVVLVLLALSRAIARIRIFRGPSSADQNHFDGRLHDRFHDRFHDREPMSLDRFFETFYPEQAARELVCDVLLRFAQAARLPSQYLRPEDSFQSLEVPASEDTQRFASDAAVTMHEAEERAGTALFSGKLITLDDYIRTYSVAARFAGRR